MHSKLSHLLYIYFLLQYTTANIYIIDTGSLSLHNLKIYKTVLCLEGRRLFYTGF